MFPATLQNFTSFILKVFLKASQLKSFCHRPYCTVTLKFKLHYLKNLRLFSIRLKEFSEPILFLNRKIRKENWYLNKNQFGWNKICCAKDTHNYMSNMFERRILRFEHYLSSYWQNIDFSRNCLKFYIFAKMVSFQA